MLTDKWKFHRHVSAFFPVLENVDAQHLDDLSIQLLLFFVASRSQNYNFELQNGVLDLQTEALGLQKEPLEHFFPKRGRPEWIAHAFLRLLDLFWEAFWIYFEVILV